eukprot:4496756-Amphidinium_carterae.2
MITTSYYYATEVYNRMKLQSTESTTSKGFGEVYIQLPQENRLCGDSPVSNLVNIYLHNIRAEYSMHEDQLHNQAFYVAYNIEQFEV